VNLTTGQTLILINNYDNRHFLEMIPPNSLKCFVFCCFFCNCKIVSWALHPYTLRKRYKSCHWGCTFSKGKLLSILGVNKYILGANIYILGVNLYIQVLICTFRF